MNTDRSNVSAELRSTLADARRVVIKLGTRTLVTASGRPNHRRLRALVSEIAALKAAGKEIVVVTSGAIGSGMDALGLKRRPKAISDLQMCAAIGQTRLMSVYETLFQKHKILAGQVLLTYDDLQHRLRHLNARNTMLNMLRRGIVPVVNENDVVSVDEIKVGDNDVLASLVTLLVSADVLVLLSTTDGLQRPLARGKSERVSYLADVTQKELAFVFGKGSELSTGGMESKLRAAQTVVRSGGKVIIADGRKSGTLSKIFAGADTGTFIGKMSATQQRNRKKWLAFFQRTKGSIVIDDGARTALEERGRSLLPIGIRKLEGTFLKGSMVAIRALDGRIIAQGLVEYSSSELEQIKGRKTSEVGAVLGSRDVDEVIHRDNLVLLR
ncbi:MAG: glutamate 5-kinase [Bdellovibrionota bacterium]